MAGGDDVLQGLAEVVLGRLRFALEAPGLRFRRPPTRLGGGRFSSVYGFEVAPCPHGWSGQFVLRLVGSPAQTRLEAGLHAAAAAAGLGPRMPLWDPGAPETGGGYLLLERVARRSYLRGVEPARFALDLPKLVVRWPRRLATVLGELGRVDAVMVRRQLELHGVAPDLIEPGRHIRAVQSVLDHAPDLAVIADWLVEHRPSPPVRPALVHGDLWPGNVFFRNRSARLIDWTRGGLDDPALDVGFAKVGFALMPEPFPPPPPIRHLTHGIGWSISRRISSACDELVGGQERVQYYEALRCAVELADVVVARANGREPGWEHGVPALVRHLRETTGERLAFS